MAHHAVRARRDLAIETAKEIAGSRSIAVASADVVGQALDLGLLDEIAVSLVPLVLCSGKPYLGTVRHGPVFLEDPIVAVGRRATHLRYRVRKTANRP